MNFDIDDRVMLNMDDEKVNEAFTSPMAPEEKFTWYTTVFIVKGYDEEDDKVIIEFPNGAPSKLAADALIPIVFTDL